MELLISMILAALLLGGNKDKAPKPCAHCDMQVFVRHGEWIHENGEAYAPHKVLERFADDPSFPWHRASPLGAAGYLS